MNTVLIECKKQAAHISCNSISYVVLFWNYMVSQHTYFDHVWLVISLWFFQLFLNFAFVFRMFWSNASFLFSRFSFCNLTQYYELILLSVFLISFWSFCNFLELIFAHHIDRVWTQACNHIKWCEALSYGVLFSKYMGSQHKYFEHVWCVIS